MAPEANGPADEISTAAPFSHILRRFFPWFCALLALVTYGYALYDPYQIDGDAIGYMDVGDYLRAHQWSWVVNGYWHPLYPAVLSLFHAIFHSNRTTELRAYYAANFAIFLLEMAAIVAFTDALVGLRNRLSLDESRSASFLVGRYAMRYLGLALLTVASQRELSLGKIRPDALLQALLLLAMVGMLRYLATKRLRYAALMGVALGCAYLAKSFAFLFALLTIAVLVVFARVWTRSRATQVAAAGTVALACFACVAAPYVAALSEQRGRFDFGDSGALNYAWYVAGTEKMHLQPYMTDRFGSSEVHLKHPEQELLRSPQILSYREHPLGTYPDWFDTTWWNDQVKPHFNPRGELSRGSRNLVLIVRYLFNHPEGWLVLALLFGLGARLRPGIRPGNPNAFWLPPVALGAIAWGIYATVNTEERYVTFAYLCILLPAFAALRATRREGSLEPGLLGAAAYLPLLLALLAAGESLRLMLEDRRQLSVAGVTYGWQSPKEEQAAAALASMGVRPGDSVACVGYTACLGDFYWARLAGVHILTEIYAPLGTTAYDLLSGLPNRSQAYSIVRAQGDRVLVADFSDVVPEPCPPALDGWQELGNSTLYELPLNVPPGAVPRRPPAASGRKPSI